MTHFVPRYPEPMKKRAWPLQMLLRPLKFIRSRNCALSTLSDRAYGMHLGELRLPGQNLLIANQPDLIKRILVDEADHFPKSQMMSNMLQLLLGDSIFVSNGDVWKRQRRMMDPAFVGVRVKVVFGLMMQACDALIARLDAIADGREVAIDIEMTHVTADIIFRTIFSKPLEAHEALTIYEAFNRFQEAAFAHGMTKHIGLPDWVSFFNFRSARKSAAEIRAVLDPIIKRRYDQWHAGDRTEYGDILQSLIEVTDPETGTQFDLRELCEQVAMLFLAGHETSASALSWALYLLSMDKAVQERMHEETVAVLGERSLSFGDIRKLDITRNVFMETLRLFPPVAFLPRVAGKTCPMRDKEVEAGSTVSVSPWLMGRHRRYWQEPDAFDPDRFGRPETVEPQRHCYLPFSKGPRVCLGAAFAQQEAAIILASLVRRYRFEPVPGFEPKPAGRLTVRSTNGIQLRVSLRMNRAATVSSPE
jgi:cytochrome P450